MPPLERPLAYFDAYACFGPKPNAHPAAPYTLEQLLAEMAHCSIDGGLVTSTACLRYDLMRGNLQLCDTLAEHEGLFPLWHVMPHWTGEFPEPDDLLKLIEQHEAARAVLICPKTAGWNPLSPTSEPLLHALEVERVPVIFDAWNEMPLDQLEQFAQQYPNLPMVMRPRWNNQRRLLPMMLHYKNLHLAMDSFQANQAIEWLVERGCGDRLLFSTNATDMAMGPHRCYIDYADVPEATRADIAGGNLTRLLKGQTPGASRVNENEDAIMAEARLGKPLSVPVIDAHAHMIDEGLHGAGGYATLLNGGPSGTYELARRMGVDQMGIMSWNGIKVPDPDDGNRCVREALDAYPDFYWGLATFDIIHDDADTLRRKMEQVFADERFLGLKPYFTFGVHYDHPRYAPLWEFGNERGLYAGMHPNRWDLSELDVLCPKYPNLTFVAYHCGRDYGVAEAAVHLAGKYDNFLAEITMTPVCLGIIDYLVQGCGADRVLYGTDLPMRDPRQQLGWVVYSRLSMEDKKKVLAGNARRLIDAVRARQSAAARVSRRQRP